MTGPGWLPRGAVPDPYIWSYDLKRGKWVSPEDRAPDDGQLVAMPPGFDPRGRGQGMQVVLSPPGVAAPPGAMAYSPATKALHGPGEVPPLDLENLSVILAPRPGPPRPPPSLPQEVPSPMAGAPGGGGPPVGPGVGSPMPPPSQPAGSSSPPAGGMGPPQAVQPPPGLQPMATPQQSMGAPGVGKPPSLYSQRAHQILQSLLGTPTPAVGPGVGQDVGVGADSDPNELRTRALQSTAQRYVGTPYALGGNDLTRGIDCSGFVNEILRGFGAQIPGRPSTTTYRNQLSTPISWDEVQPGDILLSAANPRDPVSGEHMALYVGGGQMAESRGGRGVMIGSVQGTALRPYRLLSAVPGLQDATRLAQAAAGEPSDSMQLMSAQGQTRDPQWGPGGVDVNREAILREAQDRFGTDGARVVAAILRQEGGLRTTGDNGQSFGPFHFHMRGQLPGFQQAVVPNLSLRAAGDYAQRNPIDAARWAFDNYLGQALQSGLSRGLTGEALVGHVIQSVQNPGADNRAYSRWLNEPLPAPGATTSRFDPGQLLASLGQAGQSLISGALGAISPTAYAADEEQALPARPTLEPATPSLATPTTLGTPRPAAQVTPPPGPYTPAPTTPPGPSTPPPGTPRPTAPPGTPSPVSPGGDSRFAPYQPPGPEWGGPSGDWSIGAITGTAPTTPRDSGLPQSGLAPDETIQEWIYGPPIEGMEGGGSARIPIGARTSKGRVISDTDMPDYFKAIRAAVEREAIRSQIPEADRQRIAESIRQHEDAIATRQQEIAARQAARLESIDVRRENAATRQQQEQHFWAQLVGPDAMKFARSAMPYGFIHNPNDNSLGILDANGQVVNTVAGPPITQKDLHVPGRGYYGYRPDADGNLLFTRSNVPGAEQVHEGTLLRETEEGTRRVGQLPTLPSAQFSVDEFGRIRALNQKTAESFLLTEGHPRIISSGGRTYMQQPTPTPRYTPPVFSPTTYGMPEIPWADQSSAAPFQRTPSGGAVVPDALYQAFLASRQQPTPQFVQPPPEEEAVPAGYDYTGGYGA